MGKSKVGGSAEETSEQTVQSSVNSSVEHFRHRNSRKGGVMNGEENFEDVDEYRFYEKKSNQQIFVVLFVLLILYVKRNSIKKYLK